MSFDSLLRHTVTIMRRVAVLDGGGLPTYDERGQPITALQAVGTWPCRIEPKAQASAVEAALISQAGAVVYTHTIYGRPVDLITPDRLDAADGRRFEVLSIDDAGGAGHHIEVQARRITSEDVPAPA